MANKILIADDSKMVISLVRSIFENQNEGFIVIPANDGREAIELALKELPDVILMDWQMPEMSGVEALKKLKKSDKTKHIPVIMLTATESPAEAFEAGACDLIPKPFNKQELVARVKNTVELINSRKELKNKIVENEIQRDKLKLQKELLVKQKHELNNIQELTSKVSKLISYSNQKIKKVTGGSLLLSLPVSDIPISFIWENCIGNNLYFCMGFLPKGSLASFIFARGIINTLNQFYIDNITEEDLQPSMFLRHLRDKYLNMIEIAKDGSQKVVDIVFCKIDLNKKVMNYSGINVPVFVVKNDKLVELKTDKSIDNIISADFSLTNHKVQLAKGDSLYILNDGFNESTAGSSEKSYISEEISKLILKVYKKEMDKQENLFQKTFENWRKDLKQLNDILVLGIRL